MEKPKRISTVIRKRNFLKALRKNLGVLTTTQYEIGIHHQTYYNWLEKDEKFRSEVELVKEMALDFVETAFFKNIASGNVAAQIFYLKTKGRHRGYVERVEQDITLNALNFKFGETGDKIITE